jgi:hypothetical protein
MDSMELTFSMRSSCNALISEILIGIFSLKRILQGARLYAVAPTGMLQWPPCVKTARLYSFLHGLQMCQIVEDDGKDRMLNGYVSRVLGFDHETDFGIKCGNEKSP